MKENRKKALSVLLLMLAMIFVLAACGSQESADDKKEAVKLTKIDTAEMEKFALEMSQAAIKGDIDTIIDNTDPSYLEYLDKNGMSKSKLKEELTKDHKAAKKEIVESVGKKNLQANIKIKTSRAFEIPDDPSSDYIDALSAKLDTIIYLRLNTDIEDGDYNIPYDKCEAAGLAKSLYTIDNDTGVSTGAEISWNFVKKDGTWYIAKASELVAEHKGD